MFVRTDDFLIYFGFITDNIHGINRFSSADWERLNMVQDFRQTWQIWFLFITNLSMTIFARISLKRSQFVPIYLYSFVFVVSVILTVLIFFALGSNFRGGAMLG
jgi:hypothetical protein